MSITRPFSETIKARAERDPEFRVGMLREAAELFVTGDVSTGKLILRDYVNATIGFQRFAERLGKHPKTLMRMLSASGNPTATNLFAMLEVLQAEEGIALSVTSRPVEATTPKAGQSSKAA